jgi:hypothetical protein
MIIFHTISDLRSALVNILGEGFNNYGDVDFTTYGGDQVKFDPELDEFEVVRLYTPDDGISGWEVTKGFVDIDDLLYNQRSEDDRRSLPDDLPLYSIDLTDRAKSLASFVGKEGEFDTMREGAAHEGGTPHADFVAELLLALLLGATGYGSYCEHRTLVKLPSGMTLKDTYGDDEATATFEKLEAKAEGLMLKWGFDFEPSHNHLSETQMDLLAEDFGVWADTLRQAVKLLEKSQHNLEEKDEPLARHYVPQARQKMAEVEQMLKAVENREYDGTAGD